MAVEYASFGNSGNSERSGLPSGFTIFVLLFLAVNLILGVFIGYQYTTNPELFGLGDDEEPSTSVDPTNVVSFTDNIDDENPTPTPAPANAKFEGLFRVTVEGTMTFGENDGTFFVNPQLWSNAGFYYDEELVYLEIERDDTLVQILFIKDNNFYFLNPIDREYIIIPIAEQVDTNLIDQAVFDVLYSGFNNNILTESYKVFTENEGADSFSFHYNFVNPDTGSIRPIPIIASTNGNFVSGLDINSDQFTSPHEGSFSVDYLQSSQNLDDVLQVPSGYTENTNIFNQ